MPTVMASFLELFITAIFIFLFFKIVHFLALCLFHALYEPFKAFLRQPINVGNGVALSLPLPFKAKRRLFRATGLHGGEN